MVEIWAAGGIGPARLAIMARAPEPRGYLLGRLGDRPAGAPSSRATAASPCCTPSRSPPSPAARASARAMTAAAAGWGPIAGATTLALAVTRANSAALALYRRLGTGRGGGSYHYRALPG